MKAGANHWPSKNIAVPVAHPYPSGVGECLSETSTKKDREHSYMPPTVLSCVSQTLLASRSMADIVLSNFEC